MVFFSFFWYNILVQFLNMPNKNLKEQPLQSFPAPPQESSHTPIEIPPPMPAPETIPPVDTEQPIPTQPEVGFEVQEMQQEQVPIKKEGSFLDEAIDGLKKKLRKPKKKKLTQIPIVRDEVTIQVEKIMEEGLADAFKEMTPIQKQEFKIKGEKMALEIRRLLKNTHVKVKSIFKLVLEWLKMMPGINKFYLEQEAKIKADKIIALKNNKG